MTQYCHFYRCFWFDPHGTCSNWWIWLTLPAVLLLIFHVAFVMWCHVEPIFPDSRYLSDSCGFTVFNSRQSSIDATVTESIAIWQPISYRPHIQADTVKPGMSSYIVALDLPAHIAA